MARGRPFGVQIPPVGKRHVTEDEDEEPKGSTTPDHINGIFKYYGIDSLI